MEHESNTASPSVEKPSNARVVAIASGKGGVGKTSLSANLAIAMGALGKRVLAMDADLGLSNLDLCFGVSPALTLLDVFDGFAPLSEVLCPVAEGVMLLPGCSGNFDLANLEVKKRYALFETIDTLEDDFDVLLLDTGAGIGSNAVSFAGAASDVVMVVNPEPTSLADAYAFMKVASGKYGVKKYSVVANRVTGAAEGEDVYRRLSDFTARFLTIGLDYLGYVPRDAAVTRAVRSGTPLLIGDPEAPASRCVHGIARKILSMPQDTSGSNGIRLFWKRVVGLKEAS